MRDRPESHGIKQAFGDASNAISEFLNHQGGGGGGKGGGGGGDAVAGAPKLNPFDFKGMEEQIAAAMKKSIYPA